MNYFLFGCFVLVFQFGISQKSIAQQFDRNYFDPPLNIPLLLAGNFAELRSNHFHGGLDIKTESVEGHDVLSVADGYVSRIKINATGYGKVLYVAHPNGITSVYAHLQKYDSIIEAYAQTKQYEQESFEIEIFPEPNDLPVKKGDRIAYSGNTGSSSGPHLHFELRKTDGQIPINPLLYGFDIKDNIAPTINRLAIYPLDEKSTINGKNDALIIPVYGADGLYKLKYFKPIKVSGKIGFGIQVQDYLNGSSNHCGIYSIELSSNNKTLYKHQLDQVSFKDNRYINSLVDYYTWKRIGRTIQRSYIQEGNHANFYISDKKSGKIDFNDTSVHHFNYTIRDTYGNTSEIKFSVESCLEAFTGDKPKDYSKLFLCNEFNSFETENITLSVPQNALYEDLYFEYHMGDSLPNMMAPTHFIHDWLTPVHSYMTLSIKCNIPKKYQDKAVLVSISDDNWIRAEDGTYDNGYVIGKIKKFGTYSVKIDSVSPSVKGYNVFEGKRIPQNQSTIIVKIADNLSGIKQYRGTIDENWILMEYDYKQHRLIYTIDRDKIGKGVHLLNVQVEDKKGNMGTYRAKIYL